MSFLEVKYNISKMKYLTKPSRMFSYGDGKDEGLVPTYQPNTDEMRKVFKKFDSNRDGKISREEYRAMLRALGKKNTVQEVSKIFDAADLDGDGYIDFDEFVEVQKNEGGVMKMDIQRAFRDFDKDGDGRISAEEVFELLNRIGEKCSLSDCRKMVKAVDSNGDGVIDMDEFNTMMTRPLKLG